MNSDFIVIAKVGSPKGLKGELKLNILSEGSLDIFKNMLELYMHIHCGFFMHFLKPF